MKEQDVGDRLNDLMQAHPLYRGRGGQSALGKKTGVPQPTINRILGKKSVPEMATLAKLAAEFDVTTDWLLTGRPPKHNADYLVREEGGGTTTVVQTKHQQHKGSTTANLGEYPDFVIEALEAVVEAYRLDMPREAFDAVRVLLLLKKIPESGKITAQRKDETVRRASPMQGIEKDVTATAQEIEDRLATRNEGTRAARNTGTGGRRSKGVRH